MAWSGFFKGLSATIVAVGLLMGGGYFATQFLVSQFTAPPPRPTFPNDKPSSPAKPVAATQPKPAAVVPKPSPTPSPQPSPSVSRARITLGEGLNVRQGASADTERVGGVDYDDEVAILEESQDKQWTKIRVERDGLEGWIKSGYTEPLKPEPTQ